MLTTGQRVTDPRALRFSAGRLLAREMFERPRRLLDVRYPAVLESLRLAASPSDVVLVGPVAAALRGHPGALEDPRVGLIGRWRSQGAVLEHLMNAGAMMQGFDAAPQGYTSRERWLSASGAAVSVGWLLGDRDTELDPLLAGSDRVQVPGGGEVALPSARLLRERAAASAWPADRALVPGFDAVLAVMDGPPEPPVPGRITLNASRAVLDRSVRAEYAELAITYAGELPRTVRRALTPALRALVLRDEDPLRLTAASMQATDRSITASAAGGSASLDDWIASGDLLAAVDQAVTDAYRAVAPHGDLAG